jgi:hypothetical protein
MGEFVVGLPYELTLQRARYSAVVHGEAFTISHEITEQPHLDPRLVGISDGDFGFQQEDTAGLLRYSQLRFSLDQSAIERLERAFFGSLLRERATTARDVRVQVAVAVCNYFLDIYRSATLKHWVEPVALGSVAFVNYQDDSTTDSVRLYGGLITTRRTGLHIEVLKDVMADLEASVEPPAYRLAILDAMHAADRQGSNGALVSALGALETALDAYFAARWRGTATKTTIKAAIAELCPRRKRGHHTLDDVLKASDLRPKLTKFCALEPVGFWEEKGVADAIEARNDAVHGGIAIPPPLTLDHIRTVGNFLESRVGPALAALPKPAQPRILEAFTEAMQVPAPQVLVTIVERDLVGRDLDVVLYSVPAGTPRAPLLSFYGRTMVVRFPFDDRSYTPDRVSLVLGRMIVFFSLRAVGVTPSARLGNLPSVLEPNRAGYVRMVSDLTRAVWETGADYKIAAEGLASAIDNDMSTRAASLRQMFRAPYSSPHPLSDVAFMEHVELARVAAALSAKRRNSLLQRVATTAPLVVTRARQCIATLHAVDLTEPQSVRAALITVRDNAGAPLGIVEVS